MNRRDWGELHTMSREDHEANQADLANDHAKLYPNEDAEFWAALDALEAQPDYVCVYSMEQDNDH